MKLFATCIRNLTRNSGKCGLEFYQCILVYILSVVPNYCRRTSCHVYCHESDHGYLFVNRFNLAAWASLTNQLHLQLDRMRRLLSDGPPDIIIHIQLFLDPLDILALRLVGVN